MSIAFMFPGQGSQSESMLSELAQAYPIVKQRFEQASDILGVNLWSYVTDNSTGQLDQTANTQPILLAASQACHDVLTQEFPEIQPAFLLGHSLGEYSALRIAEAMSFNEAITLTRHRGELMQEAVEYGKGAMAAILGLEDEQVIHLCSDISGTVSAANFNAPGQVVIAGEKQAVQEAITLAKELGAKRAIELPVSVPSHCALMRPAAAKFGLYLEKVDWQLPLKTPVIHNVDAKTRTTREGIISALGTQLYQPVQWVSCVEHIVLEGVKLCIELGPNKVLSGLNKRIHPQLTNLSFNQPNDLKAIESFLDQHLERT